MIPPLIEIRDRTRKRVAVLDEYDEAELVLNLNAPGTWILTMPASAPAAESVTEPAPGDGGTPGIVVSIGGKTVFNGPWLEVLTTEAENERTVELRGTDDLGRLAGRWCEPIAPAAVDDHRDIAEGTMRHFVSFNAADDAPAERKIPGLRLGPYGAQGSTVGRPVRYDPLLEVIQEFAAPDGLRFWIDQPLDDVDHALYFHVAGLRDQRNLVQFSRERGTLSRVKRGAVAPTGNYVLVGGAGETEAQATKSRGDSDSISRWGRWEQWVDQRQANDQGILDSKAAEALAAGAGGYVLEIAPSDDEVYQFGRDYWLGDLVSVIVAGVRIDGVVTQLKLTGTPSRWQAVPVVSTAQTALAVAGQRLTSPTSRLNQLERHTANTGVGDIKIWGRSDVIPTGWQVADGTMGTLNLVGRSPIGRDGSNTDLDTIGELRGSLTANLQHAHAQNHDPHTHPHTHPYDVDHGHTVGGGTGLSGTPDEFEERALDSGNLLPADGHQHPVVVDSLDAPGRTTGDPTWGALSWDGAAPSTGNALASTSLLHPVCVVNFLQRVF